MSPRILPERQAGPRRKASAVLAVVGGQLRAERTRRRMTLEQVSTRAGVSRSTAQMLEAGRAGSIETIVALSSALNLDVEIDLVDRRRRRIATARQADAVHAAMGEYEARLLGPHGLQVAVDEPYQHFQFAGRADVVAWDLEELALLHLENRTRFPDLQESLGAYNAKRAYLARELATRLGIPGFRSETHALVCLWTAEVLHALRLHAATFRATCPDSPERVTSWWSGSTPPRGRTSSLILLDPFAEGRQRRWIDLATALGPARPRYAGYAEAAERLRRAA